MIRSIIEQYWKQQHLRSGYELLSTPHVAKLELWKTSGHFDFYKENMFDQVRRMGGCERVCWLVYRQDLALDKNDCPGLSLGGLSITLREGYGILDRRVRAKCSVVNLKKARAKFSKCSEMAEGLPFGATNLDILLKRPSVPGQSHQNLFRKLFGSNLK